MSSPRYSDPRSRRVGATLTQATGTAFSSTAGLTDPRDTLDTGGTHRLPTLQGTF